MAEQQQQVNPGEEREPDLMDVAAEPIAQEIVFPDLDTKNLPAVQQGAQLAEAKVADNSPMAGALAFLNAGGKVADLREMMALQREWEANEAKKAFTEAMARFKQNPPQILKDKRVFYQSKDKTQTTEYWHATLGNVCDAIIEGLADVGISHKWVPRREGDRQIIECVLTHKAGHSDSAELDGPLDSSGQKNDIQKGQSTRTYLQRYTLLMVTGIAVKDEIMPDDDGRSSGDHPDDATPFGRAKAKVQDKQLLQAAEDAAMSGWNALRDFKNKLTVAQREDLEPVSSFLKDAARLADKPIDAN